MSMLSEPTFSIVIPTRNESKDIAVTLDRCLMLDPPPLEILVVDDSTDNTPQIVTEYGDRGVRLIHRQKNVNGCCGARNLGLAEAQGEIVIFFNADDRPDKNFIDRLSKLYQSGADYVVVKSEVVNKSNLWGGYIHAAGERWRSSLPNMEWSEGFSCRRVSALEVGGIPGDFPLSFCRDWMLGDAMNKAGRKKVVDLTITMPHYSPDNFKEYWGNQRWRGTFAPLHQYFFKNLPLSFVILREMLKLGRTILKFGLILPPIIEAFGLARYSPRGLHDVPRLWVVSIIQTVATTVGNFRGILMLIRAIRK